MRGELLENRYVEITIAGGGLDMSDYTIYYMNMVATECVLLLEDRYVEITIAGGGLDM